MKNLKMEHLLTRVRPHANPARGLSSALCLLLLPLLWLTLPLQTAFAQSTDRTTTAAAPPQPFSLPRAFSQFSATDVLKRVFDGYDPATGRVAGVRDLEGKPASVAITQAALWRVRAQDHLVVLIDVAGDDGGLCGNCSTNGLLAVLKRDGGDARLTLVARQLTLPSAGAPPVEYESLDPDQVIQYGGHDNVSLDLAPYRLSERETLIGVRLEHIWIPTSDWSTSLSLYRIEGERLVEVFREPVVERKYPEGHPRRGGRTVEKTVSTLSFPTVARPAGRSFYDLVIHKTTIRCFNQDGDDDCDPKREGARQLGAQTELWRFDGRRYSLVTNSKATNSKR